MKRPFALLLPLALLLGASAAVPVSVEATGDCLTAYVRFWTDPTGTDNDSRMMCMNINDADIESETGNGKVIGPEIGGTYDYDWDQASTTSGTSRVYVYGQGVGADKIVCWYSGRNYAGLMFGVKANTTKIITSSNDNKAGSFKWYTANYCP